MLGFVFQPFAVCSFAVLNKETFAKEFFLYISTCQGWVGTFKSESTCAGWKAQPFSQKTFSRSFTGSDWKGKLCEVHHWLWAKWGHVKHAKPFILAAGQTEQTPGVVEDDTLLETLKSSVENLPSKVKYPRY